MGPEAKIQKGVVEWARKEYKGVLLVRKNQAGRYGTGGWPDYEFNVIGGHTFFIEFKAPGEKPTPLQLQRHKELRDLEFPVLVCDNVEVGRAWVVGAMRHIGRRP